MALDPRLDPRLNPWPLPPGWTQGDWQRRVTPMSWYGGLPYAWALPLSSFQKPDFPRFGASGWNWGSGPLDPGPEGAFGLRNIVPSQRLPTPIAYVPRSRVPTRRA